MNTNKRTLQKTLAITKLKFNMLFGNVAALTGPLMSLGMTLLMRLLYASMAGDNPEQMAAALNYVLNFGLSFSIGMGAVMMAALPLAEDKEKHTLRSLMTSSVSGFQFFVGSLLPPFLVTVVTNYLIILISGVNIGNISMGKFSVMTITASLISCMLGLLLGIIAKSQVNANNLMMPFLLVLALVPSLSEFNKTLETIGSYLYTGMVTQMVTAYSLGTSFSLTTTQVAMLALSALLITAMFVYKYKKVIVQGE